MFDIDIRVIGKKSSHQIYQWASFTTHEQAISTIIAMIELVIKWYECDGMKVSFKTHVTSPDAISLYNGTNLNAIFRVIERKGVQLDKRTSDRHDNENHLTTYQDKRCSLSMEDRTVQ